MSDSADRVDAYLEWTPVRDVPERFEAVVAQAQVGLAKHVFEKDRSALARLPDPYRRIVSDEAFDSCSPAFRFDILNRLGITLNWRGLLTSRPGDVDDALRYWDEAIALAPPLSIEAARCWSNIGSTKLARYQTVGDRRDLDEALTAARKAMSGTPTDAISLLALCEVGLAAVLFARFRLLGDRPELEEAVDRARDAVAHAEASASRQLGWCCRVLGACLGARFDVDGSLRDLNEAIEAARRALESEPDEPGHATILGSLLRRRFVRLAEKADIDDAIAYGRRSLEGVRDDDPNVPARLTNLGNALLDRAQATSDLNDLAAAADAHAEAVRLTQPGDWQLASRLNNEGNSASASYDASGDPAHLERAIAAYEASIEATGPTASELASREFNLGKAYVRSHRARARAADLDRARGAFRNACAHGLERAYEWALAAAQAWASWSAEREAWDEAVEAAGAGLDALERLFDSQITREDKEAWLRTASGLPSRAAYAYAKIGDPHAAVVALEGGRAILLSEALARDRVRLEGLSEVGRAELAARYQEVAERLRAVSARPTATSDEVDDAQLELAGVIDAVRAVPGFERFATKPELQDLKAAAEELPVIYVAPAERGGVAFVVLSEEATRTCWLPEVTEQAVAQRVEELHRAYSHRLRDRPSWIRTFDGISGWLWDAILAQLLAEVPEADAAIVVPAGPLGLLPIHAASTPDPGVAGGRRFAIDELSLSYVPNTRALLEARAIAAEVADHTLLAVDEPRPVDAPALPLSHAEVLAACAVFPKRRILRFEDAALDDVQACLPRYAVHHFSCHGYSNHRTPLDSALLLADDARLSVRAILDVKLAELGGPGVRLAVLSACETSVSGDILPDEAVSLPTGLLQAGVAGVIASHWAVPGTVTALLMSHFYRLWRQHALHPREALRRAQMSVRDTPREAQVAQLKDEMANASTPEARDSAQSLWRDLVLQPPDESFHAVDWAAFAYVGA
jgi:CHAT domain-containing protein/tetratricopeptide (TPR) repeat protein